MRNHLVFLVGLTLLSACGDKGLSSESKSYNDYLDVMQGDGSGTIRPGSLRALGSQLLADFNTSLEHWSSDEITGATFDEDLAAFVEDAESYQAQLRAVAVSGELRTVHNLWLEAWAKYESAARTLRLFLRDTSNSELVVSYANQVDEGDALAADYVAQLQAYRERLD